MQQENRSDVVNARIGERHMAEKKQNELTSDLQDVHNSMLQGLSTLAEYFGLNSVMGRIYGILLLSDSPLSLDDISDRLGTSKSNISTNIRILENLRMVHQAFPVGSEYKNRRKYYRVATDFQNVAEQLAKRKLVEMEQVSATLEESIMRLQSLQHNVDGQNGQNIDAMIERANLMHTFLTTLGSFIQHMTKLLAEHEIVDGS